MALAIEAISTATGLVALQPAWSNLLDRAVHATPFVSPEWLLPWWRRHGRGRPFVLAGWNGARLAGLAPFQDDGGRLTFLGAGAAGEHGLLVEGGHAQEFARAVRERLGEFPAVELDRLPPTDPLLPLLGAGGAPGEAHVSGPLARWRERADEELRAALDARAVRRLRALGRVTFEVADASTVGEFLEALFALDPPAASSDAERAFQLEASRGLFARGWLRLHGLRVEGTLVAVLFGVLFRGRFSAWRSAAAPEAQAVHAAPLLLARALDDAEGEGATEFDLPRGPEPFRYRWAATERWTHRAVLAPPPRPDWH